MIIDHPWYDDVYINVTKAPISTPAIIGVSADDCWASESEEAEFSLAYKNGSPIRRSISDRESVVIHDVINKIFLGDNDD